MHYIKQRVKNRVILSMVGLFLSMNLFSINDQNFFIGKKHNSLVIIVIKDSIAFAEYDYVDRNRIAHCKFDTLNYHFGKFKGLFSEINLKNGTFMFKPGNFNLQPGIPDTSYNYLRDLGYLHFMNEKLKITFKWTGLALSELNTDDWKGGLLLNSEEFRKKVDMEFDSLYQKYTSYTITANYANVTIRNCKLKPDIYLESNDSVQIIRIWRLLSSGKPEKINVLPFLAQYPLSLIPLSFFNFDVAVLSTPFVFPALIFTEKLIYTRAHARDTYAIIFYPVDKKAKPCTIKVRNSIIICDDYHYNLPFKFENQVLNR